MNNVWMMNINVTVTEMKSMEQYSDHADKGISYAVAYIMYMYIKNIININIIT